MKQETFRSCDAANAEIESLLTGVCVWLCVGLAADEVPVRLACASTLSQCFARHRESPSSSLFSRLIIIVVCLFVVAALCTAVAEVADFLRPLVPLLSSGDRELNAAAAALLASVIHAAPGPSLFRYRILMSLSL
jgi:hypothetical protein